MKFLYIARINLHSKGMIGVLNKIKSQILSLEGLFDEFSFLSLSKNKIVISILKNNKFYESRILNTTTKENDFSVFWTESKNLINKSFYNMVYIRYDLSNQQHQFIDFIKSTETLKTKVCCEIASYPFYEELNDQNDIYFEKSVIKDLSLTCPYIFTPSSVKSIFGKKVLQFNNSSNTSKLYSFNKRCDSLGFKVLIIANASLWHGIDRILYGVSTFKEMNLKIDIFGNGNQTYQLRSLVNKLNISYAVDFHESKNLSFFEKNKDSWNMGLSAVGLHRINRSNAKPIKARDYVALGLPIICTKEDRIMAKNNFNFVVLYNSS